MSVRPNPSFFTFPSLGDRPSAKTVLSNLTETVLSNKIIRNRIVQSFKDSPRKPLGRRPSDCCRKRCIIQFANFAASLKRQKSPLPTSNPGDLSYAGCPSYFRLPLPRPFTQPRTTSAAVLSRGALQISSHRLSRQWPSQVQCRLLVRSAFWPMKIDLTSRLTL